jgi:hypothetical protein
METALIIYSQGDNVPTLVDLYENETIALQFNFSDIKDLKPRGSYSRTFRIPATQNNGKIFGFIQENTYQFASFNPKRKLNAIITVDTIPILEGNCQFKACYTSNGEVSEYEIVFFGNVVDFFKNIADNDFKGYISTQLQTDYNYVVEYDNIATFNAETDIYLSLTDRGQNWVGNVNDENSRCINSTNKNVVAKAGELTPFVSARYIFNKIIELSGFQLGSNSTTLTTELDFMYIPWTSEAGQIQQGGGNPETAKFKLTGYGSTTTIDSSTFANETVNGSTYKVAHLPTLTINQDPGSNIAGNVYTVPFNGNYQIAVFLDIEVIPSFVGEEFLGSLGLRLLRTDSLGNKTFLSNQANITCYNFDTDGYQQGIINTPILVNTGDSTQFLNTGDTIEVVIDCVGSSLNALNAFAGDFRLNDITFQSQEISKPLYGNIIDWSANAPIMKCSEFMDSLFKMYNLVVIPNKVNQKEIDFIPFTEYISQGVSKDWTPLLDISKDITLTATTDYQARKNTWTYKASSDLFNNLYNTQGDRVYGRLELVDPQNDFATDEQKIELYFGSTPIVPIKATSYAIPKFVNDQYQYSAPNPRILYKTGETMNFNVYNDGTNGVNVVTAYMFSHYSDFLPTINSRDLNFGQETPLCEVSSIPYKTLYARYWNEYIENIYAPDARVLEAFFSLEFADIYNFNFNDKIFIKDSYWRILSISDYVVGTQDTVKVTLIKQVTATPDCLLTPSSITPLGAVAFVDVDGNPADATQVCCEIYNYNWIDGGCYAFSRDSDGSGKPKSAQLTTEKTLSNPPQEKSGLVVTDNNFVGSGNDNSIVLGSGNRLDSGLDSVFVMGYNSNVLNGGATIGSGGSYVGEMQNGLIPVWGKGDFTNNTTTIRLAAYGSTYINMPDDSVWLVKLRLMVGQVGAVIDASVSGEYNLHIVQSGGTISLKNVTTIDETPIDIDGNFVIDLDVVGSTFAILVTLDNATAYPYNVINISGQLTYTQYHYE